MKLTGIGEKGFLNQILIVQENKNENTLKGKKPCNAMISFIFYR